MTTIIKNGLVYQNSVRKLLPLDILIKNEKIALISERGGLDEACGRVIDATGFILTAGFIDVHTHGIAGADFLCADDAMLEKMAKAYLSHGVTTVMPTLASAELNDIINAASGINDFARKSLKNSNGSCATFCGVHLEGRYLNPQRRGAHAERLLAPLNAAELDEFEKAGLECLHISAAFELDADRSFLKRAIEMGATASLGHTNATYEEALELQALGVTAYTHLFNAMPPLHHRAGGAAAACLLGDSFGEIICDGIHVSREMVALTYRMKRDRLVLISDSMEATDCPDGAYSIAGNPVTVEGGIARTHDGALAGSTLTLDCALKNLMRFCGIPLEEAIINVTEAPAREIGIFDFCGSIDVGKSADILFIEKNDSNTDFKIKSVMKSGTLVSL